MRKKFIPQQNFVIDEPVHIYTVNIPRSGVEFSLVAKMGKEIIVLMDFTYDKDGLLYAFPVNQLRGDLERFGIAPGNFGESIPIKVSK